MEHLLAKEKPSTGTAEPYPESVTFLKECIELQLRKSNDYQNPHSRVRQADYYPNGIQTMLDVIKAKYLRLVSVSEAMANDPNYKPNFESLEDSAKDLANYSSFIGSWLRHGIDGQDPNSDMNNRPQLPTIGS